MNKRLIPMQSFVLIFVDGGSAPPEDATTNEWETASRNSISLVPLAVILVPIWVMNDLMLFLKINLRCLDIDQKKSKIPIFLQLRPRTVWILILCSDIFSLVEHYCPILMKSYSNKREKRKKHFLIFSRVFMSLVFFDLL